MPGIHLNDEERKLEYAWRKDHRFSRALRSISIGGTSGLRGLSDLKLEFDYPVTVISGKNGAGKSTLLALAMLAYSDPNRTASSAKPKRPRGKKGTSPRHSYQDFVFSDFFFKGPTDPDVSGVDIVWDYADGTNLTIHKQSNKWMRYERRPKKHVTYLGISRCVPAIEQRTLRSKFGGSRTVSPTANLDDDYVHRLSQIMDADYHGAEEYRDGRYSLRGLQGRSHYSGFNMGAGEDAIVQILLAMQAAEPGSIVGIEEIELGIHSSALRKLAQHIIEISREKALQVVITSHSEHFIDELPRQARVLVERAGSASHVIPRPTSRMAASALSNVGHKELDIFVEDSMAEVLVNSLLDVELRKRVGVTAIGSKSTFTAIAKFLHDQDAKHRSLMLLDGDVPISKVRKVANETGAPDYTGAYSFSTSMLELYPASMDGRISVGRLPGGACPEKWLIHTLLAVEDALEHFAASVGLHRGLQAATALVEEASMIGDWHRVFDELGTRIGLTADACCATVIQAIIAADASLREDFSSTVRAVLDG